MTFNEVLVRRNIITKVILDNGNKSLSKELKVKIMRMRIAYNKIKKAFDDDVKEFVDQIVPEECKQLSRLSERTEKQDKRLAELSAEINAEYNEFVAQKSAEELSDVIDDKITEEEYAEIVDVNSASDVDINGQQLNAADFLEILYTLFVEE